MGSRRAYISSVLLFLFLMLCQPAGPGMDNWVWAADASTAEAESERPLQLYKAALMNHGSSEQMQADAAQLLLLSKDPNDRTILLDALKQSENSAARAAVCKALIRALGEQRTVERSEDFIGPLLGILSTEQDFDVVKLATEASLFFEYERLSKRLEEFAGDASVPVRARLNAIYALKLQPDKRAAIALMKLVDDPDGQVAAESKEALRFLGIPVGKDAETRKQIIVKLKGESPEAFLRNRLIWQGEQMRRVEAERDLLRRQYLAALDKVYRGLKSGSEKGVFVAEHLRSSHEVVRLWGLEELYQLRIGGTSELPADLGPILTGLLWDPAREVRLRAARLLSVMAELNSADKLLERIRIEDDGEVKTEVLVALGAACSYASVGGSPATISYETRTETLEWASSFLLETDANKSQNGAEVIKKLLERDGLASADVGKYLGLLGQRYEQEKAKGDGQFRGELLGRMAALCAEGSACRVEAISLFEALFEGALEDKADFVREAAVNGLVYIDSPGVLTKFAAVLVNDPSVRVRGRLINLAGEIGGEVELSWLWDQIGSQPDSGLAWEAMLKIFRRSEGAALAKWIGQLDFSNPREKLDDEQKIAVLEIAEQKIVEIEALGAIRKKLAALYKVSGRFDQAADYYSRLYDSAQGPKEKEAIRADLLDVYLRWPNVDQAAKLINNCILGRDLDPNSGIVSVIDGYLEAPPVGTDPNSVLKELFGMVRMDGIEGLPGWMEQMRRWAERLASKEPSERPKQ